jgi:predicted nuclease of predicted toxin-antitoxin system
LKVLLDHNIPVQLRKTLKGHLVLTTRSMGWDLLKNGDLIRVADDAGFDVLLTADQKMYEQQSHLERKLALVVLTRSERRALEQNADAIKAAVERAEPGGFELITLPPRPRRGR